jgi:16S rRNA (cytidine1402-2'-O)-methyltransferase
MGLIIVATPIGNWDDITVRAKQSLESAQCVIGESVRETSTMLKKIGVSKKEIFELNEHTKQNDLNELVELAREQNVALVSDCGTPGFEDPGYQLIQKCRLQKISVTTAPGPCSLAAVISLASFPIHSFEFVGFLPKESERRRQEIAMHMTKTNHLIFMDTPYRFLKTVEELTEAFPKRQFLVATDLTTENERVYDGQASAILKQIVSDQKQSAEFMVIVRAPNKEI